MKIFDKINNWVENRIRSATNRDRSGWFVDWINRGSKTVSGESVSNNSALQLGTVFACIRNISEDVGKLPFKLFKPLTPRGKEPLPNHQLYRILHDMPNEEMTSMVFRQTLTAHCLSWGNGYAEIQRDARGKVVALWPLRPDRVLPFRNENDDNKIWYEITTDTGEKVFIRFDSMLHIPGLAFDGLVGYNVIRFARECLGGALAGQKYASAFYGNGAVPGGILSHPETLSDPAHGRLVKSLEDRHKGAGKAAKVMVLEEGMTYTQTTIPPEEAQFLETRQFNVPEISRWFRMPPYKVSDTTRAQGWSTLEQANTDYVTDTLLPWIVRWEQEVWRKLLSPRDKSAGLFAKHVVQGLLRGDTKTRTESYVRGRNWGWLSADDVRDLEDMNPLPDDLGQVYLMPLNMKDVAAEDEEPDFTEERNQLQQEFDDAREQTDTDNEEEAARLLGEHQANILQIEIDYQTKVDALQTDIDNNRDTYQQELSSKDSEYQKVLVTKEAEWQSKLTELNASKDADIEIANEVHLEEMAAKEDKHITKLAVLATEHAGKLDQKETEFQEKKLQYEADMKANEEKLEVADIEKARLDKELSEANAARETASEVIESLKAEVATVEAESIKNDEEIKQFGVELETVKEKVAAAESVKSQLEKELTESEEKNEVLSGENTTIQKDLEAASTAIGEHEEELKQMEVKIEAANTQAKFYKERREELNSKLIDDAAEKIAKAEIDAIGARIAKASEDKEKWNEYVGEFFKKHSEYMRRTLSSVMGDKIEIVKDFAAEGVETFTGKNPKAKLEKWKIKRSSQIAEALRKELGC